MNQAHWQIVEILIIVETLIILGAYLHWVISGMIQEYLVNKQKEKMEKEIKERDDGRYDRVTNRQTGNRKQ